MSASELPDFSTLAAKPPQRPTANLTTRPSTSNYASALASVSAAGQDNQSSKQNKPFVITIDGTAASQEETTSSASPSSVSWRPNLDRQQSWSMQDRKRAMQSPLMSPMLERGKGGDFGFSTKDDQESQDGATGGGV
ncbi:MAG: hypothetical protein GOMPHAMPRED_003841 [Gomphillus americanus]|uniref:Uncharacterized protein n=1 Tax=Gomphillus americanus TaxID=1940652 RepID=A0A8H3IT37_9LECA|nr:MAG: hypothetical protein GOMPHAMPRED_003841 [Gomphillus americanus]